MSEAQKRAIEVLAQGGYKLMESDFIEKMMHATFLCTTGTCTLITLEINDEGQVVNP